MEINKIKEEYTKKITDRINKHKNTIIDSFVEFYGEEYRSVIVERFNNISFLYYINDITIFYIVDNLKNGYNEKFKNVIFSIPYILHLIQSDLYSKEITEDNFYKLGVNKIVGCSDEKLLQDKEILNYCIGIILRKENQNPYECNLLIEEDVKRIIALPIFSVDDKSLFHELNHAICTELIIRNNAKIIKCGLDYSDKPKKFVTEIINDKSSLEIYNIFKSKSNDSIFDDNIMKDEFLNTYDEFFYVINDFYEKERNRIKQSIIKYSTFQLKEEEIEKVSKLIDTYNKRNKTTLK